MKKYLFNIICLSVYVVGLILLITSIHSNMDDIVSSYSVNDIKRLIGIILVSLSFIACSIKSLILIKRKANTKETVKKL
ncbi:TPA: hypothetical protein GXZ34_01805 [bacterium]|nr:hypothetical protein [bacterium]